MSLQLGVVMDPLESINYHKDTTLAMLFEAQQRGWQINIMTPADLYCTGGQVKAKAKRLTVAMNPQAWFHVQAEVELDCADYDVILMRKDPPFDNQYIYITHLLSLVEAQGTLVVNKPQSLRDYNEKLATTWFPACCPTTLVTRDKNAAREFVHLHQDCVFKPLEGMGGRSVFRVRAQDPNVNVILETLIGENERFMMAQVFIPEITEGDKRIILINGEAVPYALARIPSAADGRGNLAAGAVGKGVELTARDRWLCQQVGPTLKDKGLIFVGLDVIGDYLTEINVTSPTCVRELDAAFDMNISAMLLDVIEAQV